uniref:Uncharacterized protein n=1 Tax=Strongyloides papillosus TaxID=174720 RepID=A0A0N5BA62_STREA
MVLVKIVMYNFTEIVVVHIKSIYIYILFSTLYNYKFKHYVYITVDNVFKIFLAFLFLYSYLILEETFYDLIYI